MLHRCEHCGVIKTTFRRYTKHLRHFHESAANFHVTCNISGCKDTFKVVRCFVRHVSRKHQHVSTECSLASGTVDTECADLLENEEILSVSTSVCTLLVEKLTLCFPSFWRS